ncbi:MAG: methyltransferase [Terriglobia bacterium]
MEQNKNQQEPGLDTIAQMNFSMAGTRVLATAVQLGIFSAVDAGNVTAPQVAKAVSASERGTQMLLDALTAFGLVTKQADRYSLPAASAQYLVKKSPDYMGFMLEKDYLWDSWGRLTEVVRSGRPARAVEQQQPAEEFFPVLVRSLHVMNREPARRMAAALGVNGKAMQVLDVACGSGVWSIAVAEENPKAKITAQDFPVVLETTRRYARQHGVEKQYDYLAGDLNRADFGEGRFDLAVIGNICHSEGAESSRNLFARVFRALRPGGRIAVIETIPNEERTGPVFPLIFALNMLVNTEEGGTFTFGEYTQWLEEAGFARVETVEIGLHSPLIVGCKN